MLTSPKSKLDSLHHIAIAVKDIASSVEWYTQTFRCTVNYQDSTWALLDFENIQIALVIPEQHPPHIAFTSEHADRLRILKTHRDGTRSTYIVDPSGNSIEIMAV